ncbi:MAG: LLM class flavin-dependent oxidoreductase [Halobacteria archaeon]
MKFGLLYEMQTPKPWNERSEYDIYHQALDQIVLGEEIGLQYVWEVEHHFLSEYSHSSAPEVFLGAVSQRTEKIRIGQGVALLPCNFNHPVRVAERAAVLDIMSKGRLEFGTGRSITREELEGFGIDPKDSKPMWEEAVELIPRMWMEDPFSCDGKYCKVPPRSIHPKPIQKPHPPLWAAATQPMTFTQAGERGMGALCFGYNAPADLEKSVQAYCDAVKKPARPVGKFVNRNIGALTVMYCEKTDAGALKLGVSAAMFFVDSGLRLFRPWYGKDTPGYEFYSHLRSDIVDPLKVKRPIDLTKNGTILVGAPGTINDAIELYDKIGVTQMVMLVQAGRLPHDKIMESLKLFGKEVLPSWQ